MYNWERETLLDFFIHLTIYVCYFSIYKRQFMKDPYFNKYFIFKKYKFFIYKNDLVWMLWNLLILPIILRHNICIIISFQNCQLGAKITDDIMWTIWRTNHLWINTNLTNYSAIYKCTKNHENKKLFLYWKTSHD